MEYDGESSTGPTVTLNFREPVAFSIDAPPLTFRLAVRITPVIDQVVDRVPGTRPDTVSRQVRETPDVIENLAINLISFRRIPTVADIPDLSIADNQRVFYSEVQVDGVTWYRLRLGEFSSAKDARAALAEIKEAFPRAWIDQIDPDSRSVDLTVAANSAAVQSNTPDPTLAVGDANSEIEQLMEEARQTMVAGNSSRAIQIYTKILQLPEHPRQAQAQEYLALAREKNGQIAHAKAEYQRYLSLYPDGEGAGRVKQRLAALLASDRKIAGPGSTASADNRRRSASDWRVQSFFSQFYRRDVNQQTDQDDIVSQSALYSDINLDARRRGDRFDFSSRLSMGYRNDFLNTSSSSGNSTRVSYAYADLADAVSGFRGRIGRQSRNTGGVLGRFDGFNLGYQATDRLLINAVVGKPAYSASDGIDSERLFYGASVEFGPLWDGLELGAFVINQTIDGIPDRQAIGGEFRYFGANQSLWGLIDYDTLYNELGSAFLQGSWRLTPRLSVSGSMDRRHSPFLSTGNAIIGQPVVSFSELAAIFSEDELYQLGLDRSPLSTTYSVGASYTLSQKWQFSADANQSSIEATPDSGGVFGIPASDYRYISANLIASSLIKEGDITIVGLRHSDSTSSKVMTLTIDSRYPFSRSWRVNPRVRIDRRDRISDANYEWIYTPGLRIQFRPSQKFRMDFEAGKQYSQRDSQNINLDRESYFISLGYQVFF